ncbi:MAG: hypothetical protein P8Z42_16640 [Anaerolineales bacterium]|jgi:hypothetical protein
MIFLKRVNPKVIHQPTRIPSERNAAAGYQAFSGLHEPKVESPGRQDGCICGGGCPRCVGVQAKLKVNPPGDRYEQEADSVADQLMRMPAPAVQRAPT